MLADLVPVRHEVRSRDGRWYDMRLRPYRTVDDRIDGIVVTFVEVSERHRVDEALRRNEALLRQQKQLLDLSRDPIFIWDFHEGGIIDWNRGCEQLYGYSRDEALGRENVLLLATAVPGSSIAAIKTKLVQDGSWAGELLQKSKSGAELIVETGMQFDNVGDRRLVLESRLRAAASS